MNYLPEQVKSEFDRDGYAFIPGFVDPHRILEIDERMQRYIEEKVPLMPITEVYYEDKNDPTTLKQLQKIFHYDPGFREIVQEQDFHDLAALLMETDVFGRNLQYFNKPARIGKPTPPHQDGYFFMLDPPAAVTMWLALDNVDAENGCVRYISGSHKLGMRNHDRTQTLGFSQGIPDYGRDDELTLEKAFPASPGDLLVHHALTIHRADGNTSANRSRRALGFVYFSEDAKEDLAAKDAYQKKLDKELAEQDKV
ncbi:MAG: phytanoyl-CoA dioxygenase family protein [Spirochaetales bacterium]|jgi:phytanoyl-CoA hydroxylase|nr:phytanoyl-CoA dioxygenase family protein [Spirochaetales bacterium]